MKHKDPRKCANKKREKKCVDCGGTYVGTPSSKYCIPCKDKRL